MTVLNKKRINKLIIKIIFLLLLFMVYFISFQYIRYIILFIITVSIIWDVIKKKKYIILNIPVLLLMIAISLYPLYDKVECLRFSVIKSFLESSVEKNLPELMVLEDIYWGEYKPQSLLLPSQGDFVMYRKKGDSVAILFVSNFNVYSGYLYTSDQTALDIIQFPSNYWPEYVQSDDVYSDFQLLTEHWSYLRLYH